MYLQPGQMISATPALQGSYFEGAIILITEYNKNGAVGFVVNKLFGRRLSDLEEFILAEAIPLYEGGPVDQEHLFFIRRSSKPLEGAVPLLGNVYFGGQLTQALQAIQQGHAAPNDIKILVGYCGWNQNELQEEIDEGSWELVAHLDPFFNLQ